MWRPVVPVGDPPWEEAMALGWAVGSYRGHRTLSHSGADPGFGSRLVLVPERRTGVVVLANSNTVPTSAIAAAALDIALADPAPSVTSGGTPEELGDGRGGPARVAASGRRPRRRDVGQVGSGRRSGDVPPTGRGRAGRVRPRRRRVREAVWGAIELHRTSLVWPLLRLWTALRPDSSAAWTMTGWAHQVDGQLDLARSLLRRALDLDPENDDAALIMSGLPSA